MATVPTPAEVTTKAPAAPLTKRLLSLDVVRGITIAFMIMVNNNGGPGSWRFMNHARVEWADADRPGFSDLCVCGGRLGGVRV